MLWRARTNGSSDWAHLWLMEHSLELFFGLVALSMLVQLIIRRLRRKPDGAGPFHRIRLRVTGTRGGQPAQLSAIRFQCHGEDVEVPEAFSDPPDPGEDWDIRFGKSHAVRLTHFSVTTADCDLGADPSGWNLQFATSHAPP